jgi:hypothetical protein
MSLARRFLPHSTRFTLRRLAKRVKARASLLTPWRWVARRWPGPGYDVVTFGPEDDHHARDLFGLKGEGAPCELHEGLAANVAVVTPMILPGALRVPCELHTIVPLKRPLDDILARYDRELRRTLKKQRCGYVQRQVVDPKLIEQVDGEMLVPYARARHGTGAVLVSPGELRTIALDGGRLDVVEQAGQLVACHLGYSLWRGGQRHWITLRFGYPKDVFEDAKRLREVNAMNTYLALEWAHLNGFDGYDMGSAAARPEDGLLQWKRRRDGAVDVFHTEEWLSVRPPPSGYAAFLWDHPLFAVAEGRLELHLGLSPAVGETEALTRWRQLGFSGLAKVHVHAVLPLAARFVEGVREIYSGQTLEPREIVVHAPRPALSAAPLPQPATT